MRLQLVGRGGSPIRRARALGILLLAVQEDVVQDLGDAAAHAAGVLLWPPVQLVRALRGARMQAQSRAATFKGQHVSQ